ncbi:hypothetical protein [Thiocystis violascens]|uniref:Uncharacterized protein n=1 Tax=Thiocystis violascens (strain ATCC 17096 / DSM 198 / 6111) TaxID=765911 RepID=I3YGV7_THIV6|nr:hypothetical protein [Thiocystis violascens]AFL76225.1 hypothetical protein Thivi_4422 [Thiocystis violascens DSM 198]
MDAAAVPALGRVYFAVARCQRHRSCQAAREGDNRSLLVSPDFGSLPALEVWLRDLPMRARCCRWCDRPIAARQFERRYCDDGERYSHRIEPDRT